MRRPVAADFGAGIEPRGAMRRRSRVRESQASISRRGWARGPTPYGIVARRVRRGGIVARRGRRGGIVARRVRRGGIVARRVRRHAVTAA
jgi:hypothetical protein